MTEKPYKSIEELFEGFEGEYEPMEIDWGEPVGEEILTDETDLTEEELNIIEQSCRDYERDPDSFTSLSDLR
jgi:hypothetical protein